MPANLLIVGAGGFGRELFSACREAHGFGETFVPSGFLDANPAALDGFDGYPPVAGSPETYVPKAGDVFITALGSIPARVKCVQTLEAKGAKFIAIVHKRSCIGMNVRIGEGSYVAPGASITADVEIGAHVDIFHNASIGHDTRIGDFSHVYAQCAIGGGVTVSRMVSVYPGAVIVPRRRIGEGATVGAGSVVMLDVESGGRVFGNPALPLI